jgi:hypothetical protein
MEIHDSESRLSRFFLVRGDSGVNAGTGPAGPRSPTAGSGAGDRGVRCILHCEGTGPEGFLPSPIGTVTASAQVQVCRSQSSQSLSQSLSDYGFQVLPGRVTVSWPTDSASLPRLRVAREPWLLTGIDSLPPDVWATLATSESDPET